MLGTVAGGRIGAVDIFAGGSASAPTIITPDSLPSFVSERERRTGDTSVGAIRWVWSDTAHWLPQLLASGVRVDRCHDLRLCHAILRNSVFVSDRAALTAASDWNRAAEEPASSLGLEALFEIEESAAGPGSVPHDLASALEEFTRQREALASSGRGAARLSLLLAAESAGGLIAAEMRAAGLPWDATEHDRILREALGPRPVYGGRPQKMADLATQVELALDAPGLSIDSPPKLLQALRRAGLDVQSTSKWELAELQHPVVAPLLQYKSLARLLTANGWTWLDEWVRDGRYRPVYVPGGVVTGRWASSGGGALQIPRQLRPAIRSDPGWTFVSADVSQLEPRVLAAMSNDRALAAAGRGQDLYAGIVESGAVATRDEAKIAVLGAMYGATTGDSGRLVPGLRRAYPQAMRLVDDAARTGEQGGMVSTWLGRSSPAPSPEWVEVQSRAQSGAATSGDEAAARRAARDFGRFTRNFIVQGTAAEWALAWMAGLRTRLARLPVVADPPATQSGPVFAQQAHLAFFLHDEVIVHTPLDQADIVAAALRETAAAAGELLFGDTPVEFALDVRIAKHAAKD